MSAVFKSTSGGLSFFNSTGSGQASFTSSIPSVLYAFTTFTFSNAGATGNVGPTYAQVKSAYSATSWTQNPSYLNVVTQGYQLWTVPQTGSYTIQVAGAAGGNYASYSKGAGNVISSTVTLTVGDQINICVGQKGTNRTAIGGGGGGGSFVIWSNGTPIVIAGGGGGTSTGYPTNGPGIDGVSTTSGTTDGGGQGTGGTGGSGGTTASDASISFYGHGGSGAGFSGNGGYISGGTPSFHGKGGLSFANGLVGGAAGGYGSTYQGGDGGFGGGGGSGGSTDSRSCSGGGGGYSGGAGGNVTSATDGGGGGGSYSLYSFSVVGKCTSNGYVKITKL
jgi:hypothetical protein